MNEKVNVLTKAEFDALPSIVCLPARRVQYGFEFACTAEDCDNVGQVFEAGTVEALANGAKVQGTCPKCGRSFIIMAQVNVDTADNVLNAVRQHMKRG